MKRIGFIAMSGVRAHNPELTKLGLTLPGFVDRNKIIASLPSLGLLTLAGLTPNNFDIEYHEIADLRNGGALPDHFERAGLAGTQSGAFWGLVRLLKEMGARRPPLVLLENVAGFLTSHGGRDFEQALLALNRLGYAVDAFILDAAHFVRDESAPKTRVVFVGSMDYHANIDGATDFARVHPRQSRARTHFAGQSGP